MAIDVRNRVARHDDPEVADISVESAVENALFCDLAGEDEALHSKGVEQILERRSKEDAVAGFEHEPCALWREQRLNEFGVPAGESSLGSVFGRCIPVAVVVVDIDHWP